jgi:hypothetical protein
MFRNEQDEEEKLRFIARLLFYGLVLLAALVALILMSYGWWRYSHRS